MRLLKFVHEHIFPLLLIWSALGLAFTCFIAIRLGFNPYYTGITVLFLVTSLFLNSVSDK